MPTYKYECRACGHAFEDFQSMTAPVRRKCPDCGKQKLERLIGAGAGILFKGSGFYQTDYKNSSRPQGDQAGGDKATGDEKSGADTKAASKSEASKPEATKPESKSKKQTGTD